MTATAERPKTKKEAKKQKKTIGAPIASAKKDPTIVSARIYDKNNYIVTDKEIFEIDLFTDFDVYPEDFEFKEGVAYLSGDLWYQYRGVARKNSHLKLRPGIYKNQKGKEPKFFLVEPVTEEEINECTIEGKLVSLLPQKIIDTANNREEILCAITESNKIFQPTLCVSDDLLKRGLKNALIQKGVDLDANKDRFTNKNELFNFKQVIKGPSKVSILVFDRGINALNLKYTITIMEKDPEHPVGLALKEPIVVCSEDTYEM